MNHGNSSATEPIDEPHEERLRKARVSLDIVVSPNSSTDTLDRLLKSDKTAVTAHSREQDLQEAESSARDARKKLKEPAVGWRDLPKKSQLILLVCARMSEPLTMSSLRSYMFYQLKWFDPSLPDSTISWQAGLMASAFVFAQFLTAMVWGRIADSDRVGRKKVLMIGLIGTGISCLGFGFSRTFYWALIFRCIGGALNGNVGVMRTMVSEMISEKKFQSRAFMLMPMTSNIGQLLGPLIGGYLADPITGMPWLFGPGSFIGGKNGVQWMIDYPYALPNLLSACFLLGSAFCVIFGLEETHYMLRDSPDWGLRSGRLIKRLIFRRGLSQDYAPIPLDDDPNSPTFYSLESVERASLPKKKKPQKRRTLPFHRIFTRNVVITLLSRGLLAMHIGTFQNLWFVFLSTPRAHNRLSTEKVDLFHFTGGLALSPSQIGVIMSALGAIGIFLQISTYPWSQHKFGTVNCFRASIMIFPIVYFIVPFLAIIPSTTKPPLPSSGVLVWCGIIAFLSLHVLGRTFAMPSATILVNNCCPHPSVLSTVHGAAQSVASGMRMLGPMTGGLLFGIGLDQGIVGLAFWVLMSLSAFGALFGMLAREGSGHEIILDGDEEWDNKKAVELKSKD